MSNVNETQRSMSGGGDKPPNDDSTTSKYKDVEATPVSDDSKEDDDTPKTTNQSLVEPVEVAIRDCNKLKAELGKNERESKQLHTQFNQRTVAINRLRLTQTEANNIENARAAAALIAINVKCQTMRTANITHADTPLQNRRPYETAVAENTRLIEIATAVNATYATEIATLNSSKREDFKASRAIAEMRIPTLRRQIAEAETVRGEQRERLAEHNAIDKVERQQQQEASSTTPQQHQPAPQSDSSQSQQSSSRDDPTLAIQQLPSTQQQSPPQQLSNDQQQQQASMPQTQQSDAPSTGDVTGAQAGTSQSAAITEASLRAEQSPWINDPNSMDLTRPGGGPASDSNEPMSTGPNSDNASAGSTHDAQMNALNTSFENQQLDATLPTEPNYGSILDNFPQHGFDPLARIEAPSPAGSAITLRQQQLFQHSAESSAFQSATASPYSFGSLPVSTGPTDNSQLPSYDEMAHFVRSAAATLAIAK